MPQFFKKCLSLPWFASPAASLPGFSSNLIPSRAGVLPQVTPLLENLGALQHSGAVSTRFSSTLFDLSRPGLWSLQTLQFRDSLLRWGLSRSTAPLLLMRSLPRGVGGPGKRRTWVFKLPTDCLLLSCWAEGRVFKELLPSPPADLWWGLRQRLGFKHSYYFGVKTLFFLC